MVNGILKHGVLNGGESRVSEMVVRSTSDRDAYQLGLLKSVIGDPPYSTKSLLIYSIDGQYKHIRDPR
jgi:hypothetical protein